MNLNRNNVTSALTFEDSHRPVRTITSVNYIWRMYFSKPRINSCISVTILKKSIDEYSFETVRQLIIKFLFGFVYFTIKTDDNSPQEIVFVELLTFLSFILSLKDL